MVVLFDTTCHPSRRDWTAHRVDHSRCRLHHRRQTEIASPVHRYYDPVTEQFVSVDPLVDATGTPYAYAGGDPVNGADPSGLAKCGWNPFCYVGSGVIKATHWVCAQDPAAVICPNSAAYQPHSIFPSTSPSCTARGVIGSARPNFNDPAESPGEGWEWRGTGLPGSSKGSWYNPSTDQSLHPDLEHPGPIGPHYDYKVLTLTENQYESARVRQSLSCHQCQRYLRSKSFRSAALDDASGAP